MDNNTNLRVESYDGLANFTKLLFDEMKYCLNSNQLKSGASETLLEKYKALKIVSRSMNAHREELKKLIDTYNKCDKNDTALVKVYLAQIEELGDYYINAEIKLQQKLKGWQHLYCASLSENNKNKEL